MIRFFLFLAFLGILPSGAYAEDSPFQIKVFKGQEIIPYLPKCAELRLSYYRDYPYLYDGTLVEEENYLSMYSTSDNTLLAIATQDNEIVGAVIGLPLAESQEDHQHLRLKIPETEVFYFGDIVLNKELQDTDLPELLYQHFESALQETKLYRTMIVCEVQKEDRLTEYCWKTRGFFEENAIAVYFWKEIDQEGRMPHSMVFWSKQLH